jgi:hypothetical protein
LRRRARHSPKSPRSWRAGRASSGATDGAGGNGLAGGRVIPLIRWILCPGHHRDIKQCESCRRKEKNTGSWHFEVPRVGRRAQSEVSGDSLRVPASRGQQPRRGCRLSRRPNGSCYRSQHRTARLRYPRTAAPVLWLWQRRAHPRDTDTARANGLFRQRLRRSLGFGEDRLSIQLSRSRRVFRTAGMGRYC